MLSDIHSLHRPGFHLVPDDDTVYIAPTAVPVRPVIFPHVCWEVCRTGVAFCVQVSNFKVHRLDRKTVSWNQDLVDILSE